MLIFYFIIQKLCYNLCFGTTFTVFNEIDQNAVLYQNTSKLRINRAVGDPSFLCNSIGAYVLEIVVSTQVSTAPSPTLVVYKSFFDSSRRIPLFVSHVFDQQSFNLHNLGKVGTFLSFLSCSSTSLNVPSDEDYTINNPPSIKISRQVMYQRGHLMPFAD